MRRRKCEVQGCDNPVFGTDRNTKKRFCRRHQYLRSDIVKTVKKKSLKERNKKLTRNKEDFDVFKYGFRGERQLFEYLWETKSHKSEISGRNLEDITLFFSMFAHVLNKKSFPLFRYNPRNIMIVHPEEHVLIDAGTASSRRKYQEEYPSADFIRFYLRKEELLKQYPKKEYSWTKIT